MTSEQFEQMMRERFGDGADAFLEVYPHATDDEALQSAKDIFRDSTFAWPTWAWATLQSRNGKNKAFVYYFDHRTPGSPEGANHGSEIAYVFGNLGTMGPMGAGSDSPEDRALSDLIQAYWINFAEKGDPNDEGLPEWPAFDEIEQKVMYFNEETAARKHPNLDKIMAFDAYFNGLREEAKGEE